MCVRIDSSGNDEFAGGIDGLFESTGNLLQILSNEHDGRAFHQNIRGVRVDRSNDVSIPDEGVHRGKYNRNSGSGRNSTPNFLPPNLVQCLQPRKTDHYSEEFEK